jgi:predicted amidohydrolase
LGFRPWPGSRDDGGKIVAAAQFAPVAGDVEGNVRTVLANLVGPTEAGPCTGRSGVWGPQGERIADAGPDREGFAPYCLRPQAPTTSRHVQS